MRFMDFCSGIGGGRLGLEYCGFHCVGHSEISNESDYTYNLLFNNKNKNYGDLTKIVPKELPDFDIMIGGFPCQTFSIVGKRAGFEDERGQIIYSLVKILQAKNVPYFILENVKGLVNHNNGTTLKTILSLLDNAGYLVDWKVLNSIDYGVPQMRERVYFIGRKKQLCKHKFIWPQPIPLPNIENYLIDNAEIDLTQNATWIKYINNKYNSGRFDIEKIQKTNYNILDWRQSDLRCYARKSPTLRTGRHGLLYTKNYKFYKLTGIEGLLLQGFPLELAIKTKNKIGDNLLLSQAGNAMTVPVIKELGIKLLESIS